MKTLIHKILYRTLPLEKYFGVVSRMFFLWQRLGIGRYAPATEYVYHLPALVRAGDTVIDIGANLGYYSRTLARLVGPSGRVYAVEPMPPVLHVLRRNLRRCRNVEILPYALGEQERTVTMANDSARESGYLGTGRNFVKDTDAAAEVEFGARMQRGSELFGSLSKVDFIKCDIEGYELHVLREMLPLIERFRPTMLVETEGENRRQLVALFTGMGYSAYTLYRGREVPLSPESTKDIIFRYRAGNSRSGQNRNEASADASSKRVGIRRKSAHFSFFIYHF